MSERRSSFVVEDPDCCLAVSDIDARERGRRIDLMNDLEGLGPLEAARDHRRSKISYGFRRGIAGWVLAVELKGEGEGEGEARDEGGGR